jgi:integrase
MPASSRQTVRILPHRAISGLFRTQQGEYVADIKPDNGARVRRNFGTDRERALILFDALLRDMETARLRHENPLLTEFLRDTFWQTQRRLKSASYSEKQIAAIVRFLEARFPKLRLRNVNRLHVDALRDFYRDWKPVTLNHVVQKFKQALNVAVDATLLDANPLARVKMLPCRDRRPDALDMGDFSAIIRESDHTDLQRVFLVAGLTGLRIGNVLSLERGEVVGDTIQIAPEKTKSGRWYVVPVSATVRSLLAAIEPNPLYFPCRSNPTKPKEHHNVWRTWKAVCRRVGILDARIHDLRHLFGSELARLGATEQQIGRLLCHVGQSVTSRYVHQDVEDLRPFVERLSVLFVERYPVKTDGTPRMSLTPAGTDEKPKTLGRGA